MGMFNRRLAHKNGTVQTFSSESLKRNGRTRRPIFTLNYSWIFSSALSILFGIFITYTSLHYLTAFVSPQQILRETSSNSAANQLAKNDLGVMDSFLGKFSTNQAYVRAGKQLEAHYVLPEGYSIDLYVQRCKPLLIVEVFKCLPAELQQVTVEGRTLGVERMTFKRGGFYRYRGVLKQNGVKPIVMPEKYRLVWKRG